MVGDRPYTIKVTILSLVVGIPLAAILGLFVLSLNRPLNIDKGQVSFTAYAFALPVALLISFVVLSVAVFWLPMRLARRANRILDPSLYPMTGVLSLAGIAVVAFFAAIAAGII
jgi:hypothetical protein